jgi:hypothetical protein
MAAKPFLKGNSSFGLKGKMAKKGVQKPKRQRPPKQEIRSIMRLLSRVSNLQKCLLNMLVSKRWPPNIGLACTFSPSMKIRYAYTVVVIYVSLPN